jgi:hypothetical protein
VDLGARRIGRLTGGRREGGVAITTRRIDVDRLASTCYAAITSSVFVVAGGAVVVSRGLAA